MLIILMISKNEVNLLVEGRNKVARVMLIAGGRWQVDLAKKIKEMAKSLYFTIS